MKRNSFALLYAVLLMLLIMITIAAITTSTLADISRMRKSREVVKLYQIANAGIEKGIVNWKDGDTDHCGATNPIADVNINGLDDADGKYKIELCTAVASGSSDYIISNAYYKKSRMRFRADVNNVGGVDQFTIYQIGF